MFTRWPFCNFKEIVLYIYIYIPPVRCRYIKAPNRYISLEKTNEKILLRYTFPTYDLKLFNRLTDVKCGIDYDLLVIEISPL